MHPQIERLEGPTGSPGLQWSHSIEFNLSPSPYLLLGNFVGLVAVPGSRESENLLGRVPRRALGRFVPLQPCPWTWVKVIAAKLPSRVSTPWIFTLIFQGKGLPGSGRSHEQLMLSILAARLHL